jgi:hypothetical protein
MFQNPGNLQKCIVMITMLSIMAGGQTITITGTVVDSLTSAGIGGAKIKLVEFPQCSTTTAQNGSFTLNGNPAGVAPHGKLPASGIKCCPTIIRMATVKYTRTMALFTWQ